jgi:C1A family cysteine protease
MQELEMVLRRYPVVKDDPAADTTTPAMKMTAALLPQSVDLSAWLGPVKDQGTLGACTAFAWCGLREFLYRKQFPFERQRTELAAESAVFAPLFLYYMERMAEGDPNADNGAQSRTGGVVLTTQGVCREQDDAYAPSAFETQPTSAMVTEALLYKVGAYHRVPDLETLKSVLASGYVATMGIEVYASFESDAVAATGEVPMPAANEAMLGGHEVLAWGYDDARHVVQVRNSWGSGWGKGGNFELPYGYWNAHVMDMYTAHLGKPW